MPPTTAELEALTERSLETPTPANRFDRAVAGWALGYRDNTRAAYLRDLEDYLAWCAGLDVAPWEVERAHVEWYARTLEDSGAPSAPPERRRPLSPSTVARRLSALSSLYGYLLDEDPELIGDRSPLERVRRPTVSKDSSTLGLDREEAAAVLAAAQASGPRDHALTCLLMLSALRVSEACGANVADLDTTRGYRVLRIRRKGGTTATRRLAARTAAAIDEALAGRTDGPLLLDDDGGRLDRHNARWVVERVTREAGIGKRISPHSLRHTAATLALDAGVPLRDVQDLLGHADPRTTRRYDRARESLDRDPTERILEHLAGAA